MGSRISPIVLAGLVLGLLLPARASAECKAAYTSSELVRDLTSSQLALRNMDESLFIEAVKRLEGGVGCVSNPVPPIVFASAYRYIGTSHYLSQDIEGARRWFRTALELDASYQWDASELELDNPMRRVFDEERDAAHTPVVKVDGKILARPAGSTYAIDGRPLVAAEASPNRPHIVQQIATADKSIRGTWVIDGAALPEQILQDATQAAPTPNDQAKVVKATKPSKAATAATAATAAVAKAAGTVTLQRQRPLEKTPLMVVGAIAIAGAGGIYAASFMTHDQFQNSGTTQELFEYQTLTNALVLTSGGVLLAGLGIGYWGVILDGGASVGVSGHF